jgi:nitric oxide reductase large subunit
LAAKNAAGVAGVGGLMMRKWLAYWQLAAVWIALSFLAALIYLFPIARVVAALVD